MKEHYYGDVVASNLDASIDVMLGANNLVVSVPMSDVEVVPNSEGRNGEPPVPKINNARNRHGFSHLGDVPEDHVPGDSNSNSPLEIKDMDAEDELLNEADAKNRVRGC